MTYTSKTNIVISCWNALEHTKVTLQSLFETVHHAYFLTIIDNGSKDGTAEYLHELKIPPYCEKLTIISNEENRGAGEAINQGQEVSNKHSITYTCLCNNDLFFQNEWLYNLEKCMDKNKDLAILGTLRPAIDVQHHTHDMSTKLVVDTTPSNKTIFEELQYFQDGFTFEETCEQLVQKNGGGLQVLRCPPNAVVTCCCLVRNSVSDIIGLFSDPQFEIYGSEDIDLSWRLGSEGFVCAILKEVYVHHFRHRSITSSGLDRVKHLKINNNKLFRKWREDIFTFLRDEEKKGVDIYTKLKSEDDAEYFFLRRVQENTNFMLEYEKSNE